MGSVEIGSHGRAGTAAWTRKIASHAATPETLDHQPSVTMKTQVCWTWPFSPFAAIFSRETSHAYRACQQIQRGLVVIREGWSGAQIHGTLLVFLPRRKKERKAARDRAKRRKNSWNSACCFEVGKRIPFYTFALYLAGLKYLKLRVIAVAIVEKFYF